MFFAKYKPHMFWMTIFGQQFPLLKDVAVRLLSMLTHSCDVERNCKIQKVIKTKTRNRLVNKNVFMLSYCYANLRLLKRIHGQLDPDHTLKEFLENGMELENSNDAGEETGQENEEQKQEETDEGAGEASRDAVDGDSSSDDDALFQRR